MRVWSRRAQPHLDAILHAALSPASFDARTSDAVEKLGFSDITDEWLLPLLLRELAAGRAPSDTCCGSNRHTKPVRTSDRRMIVDGSSSATVMAMSIRRGASRAVLWLRALDADPANQFVRAAMMRIAAA